MGLTIVVNLTENLFSSLNLSVQQFLKDTSLLFRDHVTSKKLCQSLILNIKLA